MICTTDSLLSDKEPFYLGTVTKTEEGQLKCFQICDCYCYNAFRALAIAQLSPSQAEAKLRLRWDYFHMSVHPVLSIHLSVFSGDAQLKLISPAPGMGWEHQEDRICPLST